MAEENKERRVKRDYANAKDVLPPDLLRAVQEHFTGLMWVPSDTCFYHERRRLVLALKEQGISTCEIAKLSGVTPRRVRQIFAESRAELSPTLHDSSR
jgi:predicted transcriptional regulator